PAIRRRVASSVALAADGPPYGWRRYSSASSARSRASRTITTHHAWRLPPLAAKRALSRTRWSRASGTGSVRNRRMLAVVRITSYSSTAVSSGADALDGEDAAERARDAAALGLLDGPVVGQAPPAERRLEGRHPEVAGLRRLDAAQGEQVGVVDDPELAAV